MRAKLNSSNPVHLEALKNLLLSKEPGWLGQHYVVIGLTPNLSSKLYPSLKTKLVTLFGKNQPGGFSCSHVGWSFETNRNMGNELNLGKDPHDNPHFNFILARENLEEGRLRQRLQALLGPAYEYVHVRAISDKPEKLVSYIFKYSQEQWVIARSRYGMEETAGCGGEIWNEKFRNQFYRGLSKASSSVLKVESKKIESKEVHFSSAAPPSVLNSITGKITRKSILAWGGLAMAFSLGFAITYFLIHYNLI